MATGCWTAGKSSLHLDNRLYYQILEAEVGMIAGAIERRSRNHFPIREVLAEKSYGKRRNPD